MAKTRERNAISEYLDQPIRLAGCPDIIVTRIWAYNWFIETGSNPREFGFGSANYMAYGPPATTEPLTDLNDPDVVRFLAAVKRSILGDRAADEVAA